MKKHGVSSDPKLNSRSLGREVDLQAMASMLDGLQVVFDEEPPLHGQRLLNALGVIWTVREPPSA